MKKYFVLGLAVLVLLIGGAVVLMPTGSTSNSGVLGSISAFSHLAPDRFNQAIKSGKFILIDIRTLDEFNVGHIKGAKQADYYQTQAFSDYLDKLDKNANYLIYCHTGRRSGLALDIFRQKGFANVNDLAGGIQAWEANSMPVER
jgi:rhodanese-related sulfurtransferase